MSSFVVGLICWLLIVLGTLGSVLPLLPGLPVAWLGLLIYAFYNHFQVIGVWGLVIFALLIGATMVVDVMAPAITASGKKASKLGVTGAMVGGLFGVFVLGPFGILLGPYVGAFAGEMMCHGNPEHSAKVAWASMYGLVIGSAFKLVVGTSMFIYFLIRVF
jgi:uncharacterized protein YqgC (DUF456 family)